MGPIVAPTSDHQQCACRRHAFRNGGQCALSQVSWKDLQGVDLGDKVEVFVPTGRQLEKLPVVRTARMSVAHVLRHE